MKKTDLKIRFLEGSLLINQEIVVVGDLHIGYDTLSYGKGSVYRYLSDDTIQKFKGIFKILKNEKIRLKKIILLGDIKHHFDVLDYRDRMIIFVIINFLKENLGKNGKIIIVSGNHDNFLNKIFKNFGVKISKVYKIKIVRNGTEQRLCFIHGDKLFKPCLKTDFLFLGHLHPAISLSDKYKNEKFKCFLTGGWKNKSVYILPSFNEASLGFDLKNLFETEHSEKKGFFIIDKRELKKFEIIIYNPKEDKAYNFGKLDFLLENDK